MIEVEKTQNVRLIDVFVLGPFMIWAGATRCNFSPLAKAFMVGSGVATIFFNAHNYIEQRKQIQEEAK